jgi:hypothetical protein
LLLFMKLLGISTDDLHNPPMVRAFVMRLTTLLVGITIAMIVGYWLATGQDSYLMYFGAVLVVVLVAFGMQRKAWILIPLTWIWMGSIGKLPIPFAVRDLGVMLATTSYVAYRVLSDENLRPKPHVLDLLVGLNVIYLAFNLVKNPVGFFIFGSETVGGRPILNICIALMAYWVMIRLPNSVTAVSRIPYFILISAFVLSGVNMLAFLVPSVGSTLNSWYSGLNYDTTSGAISYQGIQRLFGLRHFGSQLILVVCAYYSPITLFDPRRGRFYAMLLAIVCILATGFRNFLLWAMVAIVIGGWLYRRWRELIIAGFCGTLLLAVLIVGQGRFYQLPDTIQRALAFLPGQWSEIVVADTEGSSTFRFKLWKEVIDEGLIKDWWFGDGFGANLEDALAAYYTARSYKDFIIISGAYHSGPLTTVRYAGVCGLLLLYLLSITAAFYSFKCVNECRGTPLLPVAIYFAIQLIWGPVHYAFVFGGYDSYLPDLLFQVACLRLVLLMCKQLKESAATKEKLALAQVQPSVSAIT